MTEAADLPDELVGEVTWASVSNGLERHDNLPKPRPVIRVQDNGGHWLVVGLTTQAVARDGRERVAVPDWSVVGLRGPGWLWGNRLTRVSVIDFGNHIGWADRRLAEVVADAVPLTAVQRQALWAAACDADGVAIGDFPNPSVGGPDESERHGG